MKVNHCFDQINLTRCQTCDLNTWYLITSMFVVIISQHIVTFVKWKKLCNWYLHVVCIYQAYEGLKFQLSLSFTSKYPMDAPTVKFITPIYHPNVDGSGNICLDILKEKWSALYEVRTILISIQSLLGGKFFCLVV